MSLPHDHDPTLDADFQALVHALAREGLPRRAEAARAVEAVLCALALRIGGPEFDELREHLPPPFSTRLAACERHAAAGPGRVDSADAFYRIVGEDLGRDAAAVEPTARAVFAALRAELSEDEAEVVERELPLDLVPLWRRVS
jgi:uncharacterized protein (DUF2267 family)